MTASVVASAQPPGGGPRGQRGPRGGQMGRAATLATVPVAALEPALKLTADQKTKIAAIQEKYQAESRGLRPQPGGPPDPSAREKLRELNRQATAQIEATLTAEQKAKAPDALKQMTTLRSLGIPLEALGELKLTDAQMKQLDGIAKAAQEKMQAIPQEQRRERMREMMQESQSKAMAVLTEPQKAVAQKHQQRRRDRGNRNGRGGAGNNA
jgi:protein-tyrosine-phosphatase